MTPEKFPLLSHWLSSWSPRRPDGEAPRWATHDQRDDHCTEPTVDELQPDGQFDSGKAPQCAFVERLSTSRGGSAIGCSLDLGVEFLIDLGFGEFAARINERRDGGIAPQFHCEGQILDLP